MKQFILSVLPEKSGTVRLGGRDFHYLVHVRRYGEGAVFPALLPSGEPVRLRIRSIKTSYLEGECLPEAAGLEPAPIPAPDLEGPPIVLFQALPKGTKMDLIIRQAAEGGIWAVIPFVSERSVPRPSDTSHRVERWRRIIREARQQSGSRIATDISPPRDVPELLAYWGELKDQYDRPLGLLLHGAYPRPLEAGTFHGYLSNHPALIAALVGPEGGFSPEEVGCFTEAGFKPVTMGDRVLRTETAALYAVAIIRIILLESAWWTPKIPNP